MAWWLEGGVGMYAVLGVGTVVGGLALLAMALAVGAWFFRPLRLVARIVGVVAVLGCITPMLVGGGAGAYARYRVDQALASPDIEPELRGPIAEQGYQEARIPTMFGGGMTCLLLLPAALAAMVALAIPKPVAALAD